MLQERLVQTRHFRRTDDVNSQIEIRRLKKFFEHRCRDCVKLVSVQLDQPLAIPDEQIFAQALSPARCDAFFPRCSSYAAMMRCTSGWRTTSRLLNSITAMPSICFKARCASSRPDCLCEGRSICVSSPVMTALELMPNRVRNMNICSIVEFCASSRMMKALLSVRPRM